MLINAFGSLLFVILFLVRVNQGLQGSLAAWFLAAQSGLAAVRIVFRKPASKTAPWPIQAIAWLSAVTPLAMTISTTAPYLAIPGLALSIWSLAAVGDSFSIAPSDRGLVQRGPYRFLRHPMYAGELLSLLGVLVSKPLLWNWIVLAAFAASVYIRIVAEEALLEGYYRYTRSVKWKLIPLVW
ncbi:MAG: hypothetical protein HYR70_04290 [Chloroflexi bacterium]|nr:hypothetical protein [Chloroflexota bacterium]MBI3340776.1 hypothetical protein [Chloroflexota bacterium]